MKNTLLVISVLCLSLGTIWAQDAYINVTPNSLSAVSAHVGETVAFQTVHISQGNVSGPTYLYLSGYNANMFSLSVDEMAADANELDLVITYTPTKVGTHTAILNIDNWNHTGLFQSISLKGVCEDVTLHPSITVSPAKLPTFEAAAGKEATQTFTVTSTECKDYVYLRVDHIEGAGFTVDNTMLAKNSTSEVTVRFAPTEAGTYQSTVTVYTQDAESVVLTLNGTATPAQEVVPDWATDFTWLKQMTRTTLNETFDNVSHNETLSLPGWQNVAPADERPWWGHRDGYAKATAYQYGKPQTGDWSMWLVTPALDYVNAPCKVFSFKVMGEYMHYDSVTTWLEVYYVDPSAPGGAYFQDLTDYFAIPFLDESNGEWFEFVMDLSSSAETMADVFHIAFHYVGPNGVNGAVTYYIDDVTWGIEKTPSDVREVEYKNSAIKVLRDGQVVIIRGNREYNLLGRCLQ